MNLRRVFAHALLSLLLVATQQMGLTHGLSHTPAQTGGAHLRQSGESKAPAPDSGCQQCLAFAHIGAALDTPVHSIIAVAAAALPGPAHAPASRCRRALCAFRSRAPPALS